MDLGVTPPVHIQSNDLVNKLRAVLPLLRQWLELKLLYDDDKMLYSDPIRINVCKNGETRPYINRPEKNVSLSEYIQFFDDKGPVLHAVMLVVQARIEIVLENERHREKTKTEPSEDMCEPMRFAKQFDTVQ